METGVAHPTLIAVGNHKSAGMIHGNLPALLTEMNHPIGIPQTNLLDFVPFPSSGTYQMKFSTE